MPDETVVQGTAPDPAESAVPDPAATAAADAQTPKPERSFTQKELDEIVERRLAKDQRRHDKLIERLLHKPQETAQPKAEARQPTDGEPTRANFDSYEEYIEARAEWKAEARVTTAIAEREAKQAEDRAKTDSDARNKTWQQRLNAAAVEIEDLHDVLEASDAPMTRAMGEAIQDCEIGPKIAYHLATHKAEAERIANLSPIAQVRAIGKLEVELSDADAPHKEPSKAPAPITPVGKGTSSASDQPSAKDSVDEWMRKRQTQVRKRK